ncbi:lysozyme inhibitor LprI family protein [Clostridium sp. MB40-C1]|uniref:lysozyme inhibitor LprI family protein n=1 Tax=Clostridium sp. MB40-C1 TaxID=3070996 RepID=UPI0027E19F2C|nr:lysozyme inhibitor LprI family protein [Clostridium sp. MB40-C1]WMJ79322.1 lysozyme inhibitor LprI family protein [Clostridium sp. MB40-C1]
MKKRIRLLIFTMFFIFGLVGCGNSVVKDAIKQGREALQNKDYNKALASFDIALGKDGKNEEANTLKSIINGYLTAKEYLQQGKVEEAQNTLKGINSKYNEYSIKDDINKLKTEIEKAKEDNKTIDQDIIKLNALYANYKYDDAKNLILELNKNKLNDKQKEEINSINNKIISEEKNLGSNKNTANSKEKNLNTTKTQVSVIKNQKKLYINKLDNIKEGLKDLEVKYSGSTSEMKQAAQEEYKRWDTSLNEIYGVLESQLSSRDMKQLKEEQRKWISYRDNKAKKDSLEFKGGTMESLTYLASSGKSTKNRCYELVEKYMK